MRFTSETRAKMTRRALALAGVMSLGLLTSCEDGVTGPSDLSGTWRLQAMRLPGGQDMVPPDPARFTVEFEGDLDVRVQADCNGCGGSYTLDDDELTTSNLTCTLIGCPSAPLDTQYVGILVGTSEIDLDDDELTLSSSRGTLRYRR